MKSQLSINGSKTEVSTLAELSEAWELASNEKFREIWLYAENGAALCALCNGKSGWLMYLPECSDVGWSSRNPRFEGDPDATIEYRLTNGQHDFYPAAWALPESELLTAVEHFVNCGDRSRSVHWYDDAM